MKNALNHNIKNFRNFRGLTQDDLAAFVGKTKNVISNWERGDNKPDVECVEKICKALQVTPNQLFGWEPCPEYDEYVYWKEQRKVKIMELEEQKRKIQQEINSLMYDIESDELKDEPKDGD